MKILEGLTGVKHSFFHIITSKQTNLYLRNIISSIYLPRLSGEFVTEIGRDYVRSVCSLVERIHLQGNQVFHEIANAYDDKHSCIVEGNGKRSGFDFVLRSKMGEDGPDTYYVEAKGYGSESVNNLRAKFLDFLAGVYDIIDIAKNKHYNRVYFLFISTYYPLRESDGFVGDAEFLDSNRIITLLSERVENIDRGKIDMMMGRIQLLIIPRSFLKHSKSLEAGRM